MKIIFHFLKGPKPAPKASPTTHYFPRAAFDLLPEGDIDNLLVW